MVHDGVKPYPCDHCEEAFKCKDSLITHIKRFHEGVEIPQKIKRSKEPWSKDKDSERVSCPTCEKSFCNKQSLANHIIAKHEKVISIRWIKWNQKLKTKNQNSSCWCT